MYGTRTMEDDMANIIDFGAADCPVLALIKRRDRAWRCCDNLALIDGPAADDFGYQAAALELEIAGTTATSPTGRQAQVALVRQVVERIGELDATTAALLATLAGYVEAADRQGG